MTTCAYCMTDFTGRGHDGEHCSRRCAKADKDKEREDVVGRAGAFRHIVGGLMKKEFDLDGEEVVSE